MPIPAAVLAALIPAAANTVGGIVGRIVGGKEKTPDLITPAIATSQQAISDQESANRRQAALLESNLARRGSAGFGGAAAREGLQRSLAVGNANLRANISDTLARARQENETIETDAANRRRAALIQGITGAFSGAGLAGAELANPNATGATDASGVSTAQFASSIGLDPLNTPQLNAPASISQSAANAPLDLTPEIGLSAPGVAMSQPTLDNFSTPFFPVVGNQGTFATNLFQTQQ